MSRTGNKNEWALRRALSLVLEAIDVLDAHGGPPDAAAHLELVRHRLLKEAGDPESQ